MPIALTYAYAYTYLRQCFIFTKKTKCYLYFVQAKLCRQKQKSALCKIFDTAQNMDYVS